jgi:epoxyqueuosine reductase
MAALTTESLREFALAQGLDLLGVANIERFAGAPRSMHPATIFPEARSVIVVGKRILRGGWRGIEEGTYWPSYTYFDYHGLLNTVFIPIPLYEVACFLEDAGWEAVPYYPGVPEVQAPVEPVRAGAVAPDVQLAIRIAAVAAGLGEIGWSKVFLTRKFGPRQRLHAIITDAPLEPDALVKPGAICKRCMECVTGCPGAIPHIKEGRSISIRIEDETYEWADVDMGKCTLIYHGGDPRVSPFLQRDFPGWSFDVTEQEMSEEAAYKLCWTLSTGQWRRSEEFPSGYIVEGHAMLQRWGEAGSYGIEGSRGCMRSCFNYLEKHGIIEQTFKGGEFIKRPRWLLPAKIPRRQASE